jgi:hypothetical protein
MRWVWKLETEDREAAMYMFAVLVLAAAALAIPTPGSADDKVRLAPTYQPRPQTDSERLQNFKPPPPPPATYPSISGGDRGDPRLNINRDVSLGGNLSAGGVEGNVRFPIPGKR